MPLPIAPNPQMIALIFFMILLKPSSRFRDQNRTKQNGTRPQTRPVAGAGTRAFPQQRPVSASLTFSSSAKRRMLIFKIAIAATTRGMSRLKKQYLK